MRHFFEPWVTTFFEIDAAPPQIRQRVTAFQIDFFFAIFASDASSRVRELDGFALLESFCSFN